MLYLIQAVADSIPVEHPQTTFRPVTDFGEVLNDLFANTFLWTMLILVLVVVLTLAIAIRFRERPGDPRPKPVHGHTWLEIGWTALPALIVLFLTVPTIKVVFSTQAEPPADALTIEVIGHQWWWEFRYPEEGVVTANEMYVPTGRPIHLVMHSADVIHSFWIPRLGGKRDVNPVPRSTQDEKDKRNHLMFTVYPGQEGRYSGQCAEFCGESHAVMGVTAMAVTPQEFAAWAQRMKPAGPTVQPTADNATQEANQPNTSATTPAATATTQPQGAPGQQTAAAVVPGPSAQPEQTLDLDALPSPTGIGARVQADVPDAVWAAAGKQVFEKSLCVACHAIAGTPAVGAVGPNLTKYGLRPTVGAGVASNTLENVQKWIYDPKSMKPGALMPGAVHGAAGFDPTGLSSREIYAVSKYLLSLK